MLITYFIFVNKGKIDLYLRLQNSVIVYKLYHCMNMFQLHCGVVLWNVVEPVVTCGYLWLSVIIRGYVIGCCRLWMPVVACWYPLSRLTRDDTYRERLSSYETIPECGPEPSPFHATFLIDLCLLSQALTAQGYKMCRTTTIKGSSRGISTTSLVERTYKKQGILVVYFIYIYICI